ncbi:MAG: hypothetical protein CMK64_06670 [Pseudoalteromonas sp.]|nr:hypothetical protein [Pseudoalteromonas sp.]
MEIKQKKFSNHHTYTFESDHVNFAYKDKSGSGDFDFNYADFPEKSSITIEQNEWLRNVGILWCLLGVYRIGSAIYSGSPLSGTGFWLVLGIICLIWFALTKVKYSVFKTERGNVFVIQDKNHENIISELNKRKKEQLLAWYGAVNLENDKENEIEKFRWLEKQNVITKDEAEEKIAEVEFAHKDPDLKPQELN